MGRGEVRADERAARAFARIQGLLGPEAVCLPVRTGGRRPGEMIALVPWGDARDVPAAATADRPWPGSLPPPHPTTVLALPAVGRGAVGCRGIGARQPSRIDRR